MHPILFILFTLNIKLISSRQIAFGPQADSFCLDFQTRVVPISCNYFKTLDI
jgi:hypothetical protein